MNNDFYTNYYNRSDLKVFEVDINKLIENIFSKLLPYLVKKLSLLWVVLFSCSTVISFMILFYSPKIKLANDVLNFNITASNKRLISTSTVRRADESETNNSYITVYIIWGSQIHETSSNGLEPIFSSPRVSDENLIDPLLDRDLETNGFENFNLIYQLCQSVRSTTVLSDDDALFKQVYCFGDFLERSFVKFSSTSNAVVQPSMKIFQNYCDPAINPAPFERFINNRKSGHNENKKPLSEDKNLFIDCIKWWSLNLLNNRSASVLYGPLFLVNRVLPSVYLIRLETGLKASQDFEIMQENFKRLVFYSNYYHFKHHLVDY